MIPTPRRPEAGVVLDVPPMPAVRPFDGSPALEQVPDLTVLDVPDGGLDHVGALALDEIADVDLSALLAAPDEERRAAPPVARPAAPPPVAPAALAGLLPEHALAVDLDAALREGTRAVAPTAVVVVRLGAVRRALDSGQDAAAGLVLGHVATDVHEQVRCSDAVYRWGDDGLALVLRRTRHGAALRIVVRLRDVIGASCRERASSDDLSIGWSVGTPDGSGPADAAELLSRAAGTMTSSGARS